MGLDFEGNQPKKGQNSQGRTKLLLYYTEIQQVNVVFPGSAYSPRYKPLESLGVPFLKALQLLCAQALYLALYPPIGTWPLVWTPGKRLKVMR